MTDLAAFLATLLALYAGIAFTGWLLGFRRGFRRGFRAGRRFERGYRPLNVRSLPMSADASVRTPGGRAW